MSLFIDNLKVLESRFTGLGSLIEKETSIEGFESFNAKDGSVTASIDGKMLCSRHNPKREAVKLIESVSFDGTGVILFSGFGLGWHIEEFARRYSEITIIIAIPNLSLFKAVLEVKDFTSLFFQNRIVIIAGENADPIIEVYKEIAAVKVFIFPFEPLREKFSDYYESLIVNTEKWLNRKEINRNTLKRFGRLWIHNFALNLSSIKNCSSLKSWDNAFKGKPAIVVAAGPSLKKEISNIKLNRDKAIVVAVDTSLIHLLNEGINPDFTVVTDPQFWNSRHLDYCDCSKTILVSELSTHPSIFRKGFKHILLSASPFPIAKKIEESIDVKIKLKSGGSVATAAWGFIVHLGCSEIYTVGLDLGFPGGETHCQGSFFEKRMMLSTNRLDPSEKGAWSYLHLSAPYPVPNNNNGQVLTDQRMQIYINWFKEQMALKEIKGINLSRYGSKIDGLELGSFDSLSQGNSIRDFIDEEISKRTGFKCDVSKLKNILKLTQKELNELKTLIDEAISISKQLKKNISEKLDISVQLNRLDKLDFEITNCASKEIAGFIVQPLLEDIAASNDKDLDNDKIVENSLRLYNKLSESLNYNIYELKKSSI